MTPVADPTLRLERSLVAERGGLIIGCDEVGRGALAGPVAVGVCVVEVKRSTRVPAGLRDSKMLSELRREQLAPVAMSWGVAHAVGYASAAEIDEIGITACLGLAGWRAMAELALGGVDLGAATVVLDGHFDWLTRTFDSSIATMASFDSSGSAGGAGFGSGAGAAAVRSASALAGLSALPMVRTRIKADRDCASVAAASVISKVARDRMMIEHHDDFPDYGWARNKGYGSEEHRDAILTRGATDLHRHTWLSGILAGETAVALDGFEALDEPDPVDAFVLSQASALSQASGPSPAPTAGTAASSGAGDAASAPRRMDDGSAA